MVVAKGKKEKVNVRQWHFTETCCSATQRSDYYPTPDFEPVIGS
jgi:hypothetical protein